MERGMLCALLRDRIRSGDNAAELLLTFNNIYKDTRVHVHLLNGYRRLFLNAATEYNHVELVTLLLTNELFSLDTRIIFRLMNPLFVAIYTDNVKLVELFLRALPWRSMKSENPIRLPTNGMYLESRLPLDNDGYEMISAVEFACILNKTKILQFMVAYHNNNKQDRYVAFVY